MPAGAPDRSETLRLQVTDRGDGPVFERFFAGYDRAFVLPDEKESREGLSECLALNHGAAYAELVGRYGPFRELCLVAETADGAPVGGANFIAMPADAPGMATANLNYIYIDPQSRGRGYLRRLVEAVKETAATLFEPTHARLHPLVFIEQNDPFKMSAEDYARDTALTGLDQVDRLRIWARLGARVVDFPYVQPALSDDQAPDDSPIYAVLGADGPRLDPAILQEHLSRFFGISVLKGQRLMADAAAVAQLRRLEAMTVKGETVALLDPLPLLNRLSSRDSATALFGCTPASFRKALARLAA